MNILILGGTVFLGRHIVYAAAKRGHTVTLFHRGKTNAELFDGFEVLHGDRDDGVDGLAALGDRRWDAVVDTCGYTPGVVRASAQLLAERTDHYVFISSISVLADHDTPRQTEDTTLAVLPEGADRETVTGESYGPLKALCEAEVNEAFGERAIVVRPGLIVGPFDPSDRFTYWPRRIAQGGSVLASPQDQPVQLIDVRDLAEWVVHLIDEKISGTFNATGPREPLTMGQMLLACQAMTASFTEFVHVPDEFLVEHDVVPFVQLPLWIPAPHHGFLDVDISRALANGLVLRPLGETICDTLNWDATRPDHTEIGAGLTFEREQELIGVWESRQRRV